MAATESYPGELKYHKEHDWARIEGGGEVTSGTHSPMLDRGIGLGYVPAASAAVDRELSIDVRGRKRRGRVVRRPIYKREESR